MKQAVVVSGRFKLIGNHVSGFDEEDSAALLLNPDRFGEACRSLYRGSIFQNCSQVVKESQPGTWKASHTDGNLFVECGETSE